MAVAMPAFTTAGGWSTFAFRVEAAVSRKPFFSDDELLTYDNQSAETDLAGGKGFHVLFTPALVGTL